jgi:hypothetical protein
MAAAVPSSRLRHKRQIAEATELGAALPVVTDADMVEIARWRTKVGLAVRENLEAPEFIAISVDEIDWTGNALDVQLSRMVYCVDDNIWARAFSRVTIVPGVDVMLQIVALLDRARRLRDVEL